MMSPNVNVSFCLPQRECQTTQPWVMSYLERVQPFSFFFFFFCLFFSATRAAKPALDESCFMFNSNRFDVGGLLVLSARSRTISELFDKISKPVCFLKSAKMFTWKMLEFFWQEVLNLHESSWYNHFIQKKTPLILSGPVSLSGPKFEITFLFFCESGQSRSLLNYVKWFSMFVQKVKK